MKASFQQYLLALYISQGSCSGGTLFFAAVSAPYATSSLTTTACPSLAAHMSGESPCEHGTASIHMIDCLRQAMFSGCCFVQQQGSSNAKRQSVCGAASKLYNTLCYLSHAEGTADYPVTAKPWQTTVLPPLPKANMVITATTMATPVRGAETPNMHASSLLVPM